MLPASFPAPEIFLPGKGEPALRWGVIAPGGIAGRWAQTVMANTHQRVVAVASRSQERADGFAAIHGIERAYGSYAQLVDDPGVEVVYIAAPQSEHLTLGLLAIAAGKHVLIEKPMATNATDARLLVAAARAAGVLLMEALWSRYLPQTSVLRQLVADGVLGEVNTVMADHGQSIPVDPTHRLYRADLGGGALLDLGIYPVQFASMVLGPPTAVTAIGGMTVTGVDAYATLVLEYKTAAQSTLTTSLVARTPSAAVVAGPLARVEIDGPFFVPSTLTLADNQFFGESIGWSDPTGITFMDGLCWEATALARYVGEGRTESPLHTLDETVSILETMDEALRQLAGAVGKRRS